MRMSVAAAVACAMWSLAGAAQTGQPAAPSPSAAAPAVDNAALTLDQADKLVDEKKLAVDQAKAKTDIEAIKHPSDPGLKLVKDNLTGLCFLTGVGVMDCAAFDRAKAALAELDKARKDLADAEAARKKLGGGGSSAPARKAAPKKKGK